MKETETDRPRTEKYPEKQEQLGLGTSEMANERCGTAIAPKRKTGVPA